MSRYGTLQTNGRRCYEVRFLAFSRRLMDNPCWRIDCEFALPSVTDRTRVTVLQATKQQRDTSVLVNCNKRNSVTISR